MITKEQADKLHALAWTIRYRVVEMIGIGKTGHIGGSFSAAEIVSVLYGHQMQHDPQVPDCPTRDRFVMSKGHAALAQYAALAEFGYFPLDELSHLKKLGAMLQGHPDLRKTPGIEANTGSLGQGLSIAQGMALGIRLDKRKNRVYCLVGDGEIAEGQIWEAAMSASHYKLDNLTVFVDYNRIQATDHVVKRLNTNPMNSKWEAFGWHVIEVDGHDCSQICQALEQAEKKKGSPTAIIAHTTKGKGVGFAEDTAAFHNGMMDQAQYQLAIDLLSEKKGAFQCKI